MRTVEEYEKEREKFQQQLEQKSQLLEKLTKEKAGLTVRYKELSREIKRLEKLQDGGEEGDQTERLVDLQMQIDDILSKRRAVDKEMKGLPEKIAYIKDYLSERLPKFWEEQKQLAEKERLEALREEEAEEAQQQEFLAAVHKLVPGTHTPYKKNRKAGILVVLCAVSLAFTVFFLVTSFDYKLAISVIISAIFGAAALVCSTSEAVEIVSTNQNDEPFFTRAVGVTYANDDGSSRQRILRKATKWCEKRNVDRLPGYLEFYYFEDEPALAIKTHLGQIGHIPKDSLQTLIPQFKSITKVIISPDSFTKNGELIYRADVTVYLDDSQSA